MSNPDITFIREAITFAYLMDGVSSVDSVPSIRKRTFSSFSYGSMWISLAFWVMAAFMIILTNLTTGASESISSSTAGTSCSSFFSSQNSRTTSS